MYYNLTAIILKRQVFKEDDLLLTVYSKEKGKAILQARSAKKIKSKLAGHLEPFTLSKLNITHGRYIDQLIGAQSIITYSKIKKNLLKIGYTHYVIELVDSLTLEDHPDPNLFILLYNFLNFLESLEDNRRKYIIARVSFGFKLLSLLGVRPIEESTFDKNLYIDYIINNNILNILSNKDIAKNLYQLHKILDKAIDSHLKKQLKTKEFLKTII